MSAIPVEEPKVWWRDENGYIAGKCINEEADLWVCLAEMIYTWRVMLCNSGYVFGFACYDKATKLGLAVEAYERWDGTGLPLEGYERTVNLGGDGEKNH